MIKKVKHINHCMEKHEDERRSRAVRDKKDTVGMEKTICKDN